jgi:ribosomal protein S17E
MSQDFSMENDSYFITFIAERVYRGTCLNFWLSSTNYNHRATGWVTGIDDDFIQICTFENQDIMLINRYHIVTVEEHLTNDGRPYKIADVPDKTTRDQIASYTKKLTEKAKEFKNSR